MSFEASVARLQEIVAALERQDLDLDRALHLFEEGVVVLRQAQEELSRADAQVKLLVEKANGTFELPDFGE